MEIFETRINAIKTKKKMYHSENDTLKSVWLSSNVKNRKTGLLWRAAISSISTDYYLGFNQITRRTIRNLTNVSSLYLDMGYRKDERKEFNKYHVKDIVNLSSRPQYGYSYVDNLEEQFNELANKWKEETGLFSLPPKKINATYLKIIHKGDIFLPFILKDMMKGGSVYWHFALKAITGNDEIPDDFSKSKLLKDTWIKWGKDNFII